MPPTTAPKVDAQFFTLSDEICRDPERRRVLNHVIEVSAKSSTGHLFYPEALQLISRKQRHPENFCSFSPCLAGMCCTAHFQTHRFNKCETIDDLKEALTVPTQRKTQNFGPLTTEQALQLVIKTSGNISRQQALDSLQRKAKEPSRFCKEPPCVQLAPCARHMRETIGDIARLLKLPR